MVVMLPFGLHGVASSVDRAAVALEALSPRVDKLLNPGKPHHKGIRRSISKRKRKAPPRQCKPTAETAKEDKLALALRHHKEVGKHPSYRPLACPGPPPPCAPISPSSSPYAYAPSSPSLPRLFRPPWRVQYESPKSDSDRNGAGSARIHLPQLVDKNGHSAAQRHQGGSVEPAPATLLPKPPDLARQERARSNNSSESSSDEEASDLEASGSRNTSARAVIRKELSSIESYEQLEGDVTKTSVMLCATTDQRQHGHHANVEFASLHPATESSCELAFTMLGLIATHLPGDAEDVKRFSLASLLHAEANRRSRALGEDGPSWTRDAHGVYICTKPHHSSDRTAQVDSVDVENSRRPSEGLARADSNWKILSRVSTTQPVELEMPPHIKTQVRGGTVTVTEPPASAPRNKSLHISEPNSPKKRPTSVGGSPLANRRSMAVSHQQSDGGAGRHASISSTASSLPSMTKTKSLEKHKSTAAPKTQALQADTSNDPGEQRGSKCDMRPTVNVPRYDIEAAFTKFMDDGCVHHDDCKAALEVLGFIPQQLWVDQAFGKVSKFITLRLEQFDKFVQAYGQRQREANVEAFIEADEDKSGYIDIEELKHLLRKFGIEPMTHVLHEVIREVDKDGSGVLNIDEFNDVMEIIRGREGFSLKDYNNFLASFARFDTDGSHNINRQELMNVFQYLGITTTSMDCQKLIEQLDCHNAGALSEREFLCCMRRMRQLEVEKFKNAIRVGDTDGSGLLRGDEIQQTMQNLGYCCTKEAIKSAGDDLGMDPWAHELDGNELWTLLSTYREREGFSEEDMQELTHTFHRYCALNYLSNHDLDAAIRHMGYALPFEVQRNLTFQVDADMSGQLSLKEFKKLIRLCIERETNTMKDALHTYDQTNSSHHLMSLKDASYLLKLMDYVDEGGHAREVFDDDIHAAHRGKPFCANIFDLVGLLVSSAPMKRNFMREHYGFSYSEVKMYKYTFHSYDEDQDGKLNYKDLLQIFHESFPELASVSAHRSTLMDSMKEFDFDHTHNITFKGFLGIMSRCHEMHGSYRLDKENRAIMETGFSQRDIGDFRVLFLSCDLNHDLEMDFAEFKKMIGRISPMGEKNSQKLQSLFVKLLEEQKMDWSACECADFPEFLWLLYSLLETNFAGLRQKMKPLEGLGSARQASDSH